MEFLLNPQKGLWNITVGNPSSEFHTENRHKTSQDNFAKEEHPPPKKKVWFALHDQNIWQLGDETVVL